MMTFGLMFVSGGFVLLAAFLRFTYFGLIERVTIGAFIVWVILLSARLTARSLPSAELFPVQNP
jgi:hypothetical protein